MNNPPSSSWLLIFKTQKAATIASQTLIHSDVGRRFKVHPAPGPDEINWQALWKPGYEKNIRSIIVYPFIAFLILLPLGIFAGSLTALNKFLCEKDTDYYLADYCNSGWKDLIAGWVPSILITIWQNMIMPNALYYFIQVKGYSISFSQLDGEITRFFNYFNVINIFIGAMLGGSILSELNNIITNPGDIFDSLGKALPYSSNFFINYITLRAFCLVPFQLLIPHPGVWHYLFQFGGHLGFARTKRQLVQLFTPRSVRYGREYGIFLLMFLITFAYSVISPIILPIALFYFIIAWVVWRYLLLYVYVRKYESGGKMWPYFFNRLLFALWLFQFFTSSFLLFKEAYLQASILWITCPIILMQYYSYCTNRFKAGLDFVPLDMAHSASPATIDPQVYIPPPLVKACAGWHPEYMKAWEGWGSPAYTY